VGVVGGFWNRSSCTGLAGFAIRGIGISSGGWKGMPNVYRAAGVIASC
jgi:hypothetical protein